MRTYDRDLTDEPVAYLITFRCYGTWLHGDQRHSMDRSGAHYPGMPGNPPDAQRERRERRTLRWPSMALSREMRLHAERAIRSTCAHREWHVHALKVRHDHVHVVVSAPDRKPERVMIALKAWVTRMLREAGHVEADRSVWSRHGSTRYLWNEEQLGHAVAYVVEGHALPPSMGTSG